MPISPKTFQSARRRFFHNAFMRECTSDFTSVNRSESGPRSERGVSVLEIKSIAG